MSLLGIIYKRVYNIFVVYDFDICHLFVALPYLDEIILGKHSTLLSLNLVHYPDIKET
jgi:hypothetical protein